MSDVEYWNSLGMTEQKLGAFPIISMLALSELVIQARRAGREEAAKPYTSLLLDLREWATDAFRDDDAEAYKFISQCADKLAAAIRAEGGRA